MTDAQKSALLWFRNRGGDGMFMRDGVLLAAGQRAPIMRATWNALRDEGFVEQYNRLRLRTTIAGREFDLSNVEESTP